MNANDNFDALWSNLRSQVKEAREKRTNDSAYLFGQVTTSARTEVHIGEGDSSGALVKVLRPGFSAAALCSSEELRAIAVHCLAAAEECDEDAATLSEAHSSLLTGFGEQRA